MRGRRRFGVKRLIYKEYRLFFICAHDKSPVKTPVTIKYASTWLRKVAPLALFSIRVIVSVNGVPIPALPGFIPGADAGEQFKEVIEHMGTLLESIDPQLLSSLQLMLDESLDCLNREEFQELIRKREGEIPENAYGAIAIEAYKPGNRDWMEEMEITHNGSEHAWVKKMNVQAFQKGETADGLVRSRYQY